MRAAIPKWAGAGKSAFYFALYAMLLAAAFPQRRSRPKSIVLASYEVHGLRQLMSLTSISGELGGKLLELLKEIIPRLTRVAVILPDNPASKAFLKETAAPAQGLQVQLIPLTFRSLEERHGSRWKSCKNRVCCEFVAATKHKWAAKHQEICEYGNILFRTMRLALGS